MVTSLPKRRYICPNSRPDVAAAYDDEMAREGVEFEHGGIGKDVDLIEAGHIGDVGASAYIEEDAIGGEEVIVDANRLGGFEAGMSGEDSAALHSAEPAFYRCAGGGGDGVFSGFDGLHVHLDGAPVV